MRWYKHMANSRRSPLVRDLRRVMGPRGVLAWNDLLEVVAEKYEGEGIGFTVKLHRLDWMQELSIPKNCPHLLTQLFDLAQSHGGLGDVPDRPRVARGSIPRPSGELGHDHAWQGRRARQSDGDGWVERHKDPDDLHA